MVVTKQFAQRLEQSEIDTLFSRLKAIKAIDGNPMKVDIQQFGHATAFSAKNIPGPSFNTVKGLKEGDEEYIDSIIDFYRQKEIPVRFEVTPGHSSPKLLAYLSEKGFYQTDFHTTLFQSFSKGCHLSSNSEISIRRLNDDEFDLFAEIYVKGFQMPAFVKDGVAQNNKVLSSNENWSFYLASVENEPAGIGVLFCKNKVATLAAAVTVPTFRNRGVQQSLLKHRMNQAILNDCELLVGQARFGSVSQNNMERVGMKIAYTKAIWVRK
ncbi:GNAT family N-acetyltransferase [Fredinandcohnia humi]